jgi:hypothetical protein
MANDIKKKRVEPPSAAQLQGELRTLRNNYDQLRVTVGKLKDILQVQDNWHSRVSKWVGGTVKVQSDHEPDAFVCKLLWTDRYNLGVEIDGRERLYNKGHVVWIEPA